jgi:hypothetical protein
MYQSVTMAKIFAGGHSDYSRYLVRRQRNLDGLRKAGLQDH